MKKNLHNFLLLYQNEISPITFRERGSDNINDLDQLLIFAASGVADQYCKNQMARNAGNCVENEFYDTLVGTFVTIIETEKICQNETSFLASAR